MDAVRQVIDSTLLNGVISLPRGYIAEINVRATGA